MTTYTAAQIINAATQVLNLGAAIILDSSQNILTNLDALNSLYTKGDIGSVEFNDAATPTLSVTGSQFSNDSGVISLFQGSYWLSVQNSSVALALQIAGQQHVLSISILDSAQNVDENLNSLEEYNSTISSITIPGVRGISGIDNPATITVSPAQIVSDSSIIEKLHGLVAEGGANVNFNISGNLTFAQAIAAYNINPRLTGNIVDSSQNLQNAINNNLIPSDYRFQSIVITDTAEPTITIQFAQETNLGNSGLFNAIITPYNLVIAEVSISELSSPIQVGGGSGNFTTNAHLQFAVSDTAANVQADIDNLETMVLSGKLASITLTDSTEPTLTFTTSQQTVDASAIALIKSPYFTSSSSASQLTVAQALADFQSGSLTSAQAISDTAANVTASLDTLQTLAKAGDVTSITLTDSSAPTLLITATQLTNDGAVLGDISSTFSLAVAGVTASAATSTAAMGHVTSVAVSDTAADVQTDLSALESLASSGKLASITLTDIGTPTITITQAQDSMDASALQKITGAYTLDVTGATTTTTTTVETASAAFASYQAGTLTSQVAVSDSAANIVTDLDQLDILAAAGDLSGITLTDSGFSTLSIQPVQLIADASALNDISGNFVLSISATAPNLTINGLAGHGNTAVFTGGAAEYSVAATGNGNSFTVTDTGTGRTSVDTLTNVQALQFSDYTDIVAQTPGTNTVTTGNITELYGAVFGRLPDVPGLAYYENELQTNPKLSLTTLAQDFLSSPEYTGNAEHNYAQTAAGDAQFITDSYNNLLHRTPESAAIPYYQNLISLVIGSATPGTSAYTAAELLAHATVLVDFSASAEFLNDVQITASSPASATHWLILV